MRVHDSLYFVAVCAVWSALVAVVVGVVHVGLDEPPGRPIVFALYALTVLVVQRAVYRRWRFFFSIGCAIAGPVIWLLAGAMMGGQAPPRLAFLMLIVSVLCFAVQYFRDRMDDDMHDEPGPYDDRIVGRRRHNRWWSPPRDFDD